MLTINNLHANIDGKAILKGLNLTINAGEIHAIMGPNGAGKSTLASVLAGREEYEVTEGSVDFDGKDLLEMSPDARACEGLFLAFQYPVEIPGVSMTNFMRASIDATREYKGLPKLNATEFLKLMKEKQAYVELNKSLTNRSVNEGFFGGRKEKK